MAEAGIEASRIAGTSLDSGAEIDALVALPAEEREEVIAAAVAGQSVSARPRPAPVEVEPETPTITAASEAEVRQKCYDIIDRLSGEKLAIVVARLAAMSRAASAPGEVDPADLLFAEVETRFRAMNKAERGQFLALVAVGKATTVDQATALRGTLQDLGPRMVAFIKERRHEADAIDALHNTVVAMEAVVEEINEALIEAWTPEEPAPVEPAKVEVEVAAGVEPVQCPMADCEGGNRWETVDDVRHDLGPCGVCHPEAYAAEAVEPPPQRSAPGIALDAAQPAPKPKSNRLEFVVAKPKPNNKRSRIGEVRQATPESIAAYNAARAA